MDDIVPVKTGKVILLLVFSFQELVSIAFLDNLSVFMVFDVDCKAQIVNSG